MSLGGGFRDSTGVACPADGNGYGNHTYGPPIDPAPACCRASPVSFAPAKHLRKTALNIVRGGSIRLRTQDLHQHGVRRAREPFCW